MKIYRIAEDESRSLNSFKLLWNIDPESANGMIIKSRYLGDLVVQAERRDGVTPPYIFKAKKVNDANGVSACPDAFSFKNLLKNILFYGPIRIEEPVVDLFDEEAELERKQRMYEREFSIQDEMAEKSEVFRRILESEMRENPAERYESTNSPKSKTRNALIVRHIYPIQEEWEQYLLTNPFYEL